MWDNFKGSLSEICRHCNLLDDEDHRLNVCTYISRQYCSDNVENYEFTDIYSNNLTTLDTIMNRLNQLWEFRYANGRMKKIVA